MTVPATAKQLRRDADMVRLWAKRFNASGLAGLADMARPGRPARYTPEVSEVVAAALTPPGDLGLPFVSYAGSPASVPERGQGHRDEAEPDR